MEDSTDDEEEEEELLVYANFEEGTVDREIFQQPDLKFKIIGLESASPIVQLGDTTFKGSWHDTIGTKVFFEEDPSPEQVDPVFTVLPPKMLKYKCMSRKTLELSRIFLKPKNPDNSDKKETKESEMSDIKDFTDSLGEQEIMELVTSTVHPNIGTDAVMKDIIEESTMEITEDNQNSIKND